MHIGGFRGAGAEIAALCGRGLQETEAIARAEGIPFATNQVKELCKRVDVVVVSGPDTLHAEHVDQALDAGCHVLSEKPLTREAADAQRLMQRADDLHAREGRICAVSFPYRMIPPVVELRQWLLSRGSAGWLTMTGRSSFAAALGRGNHGPMMGASGDFGGASHVIDAALWLLGAEPVWVEASMSGRPVHSFALQVGLSTGGRIALSHVASHDPGIINQWHMVSDTWEARLLGEYRPWQHGWRIGPAEVFHTGTWHTVAEAVSPELGGGDPWARSHVATARAFLTAMSDRSLGKSNLARFRDGAWVQVVFAAAMQAEAEGRRVPVSLSAAFSESRAEPVPG